MGKTELAIAAWLAAVSGCGTVENLRGRDDERPALVYGGVALDAHAGVAYLTDSTGDQAGLLCRVVEVAMGSYLLGVDLPCCAVADTLSLPVTLTAAHAPVPQSAIDSLPAPPAPSPAPRPIP